MIHKSLFPFSFVILSILDQIPNVWVNLIQMMFVFNIYTHVYMYASSRSQVFHTHAVCSRHLTVTSVLIQSSEPAQQQMNN